MLSVQRSIQLMLEYRVLGLRRETKRDQSTLDKKARHDKKSQVVSGPCVCERSRIANTRSTRKPNLVPDATGYEVLRRRGREHAYFHSLFPGEGLGLSTRLANQGTCALG